MVWVLFATLVKIPRFLLYVILEYVLIDAINQTKHTDPYKGINLE